jgi:hypothetical protein
MNLSEFPDFYNDRETQKARMAATLMRTHRNTLSFDPSLIPSLRLFFKWSGGGSEFGR